MADGQSSKNFIAAEEEASNATTNEGYGWVPPSHCSGTISWVPTFGCNVPQGAVHAGLDQDGGPILVGRAFHEGDCLPCKVCPSHGCAYISYGGDEVSKENYEVLVSDHVAWRNASGGYVPPEAIKVGQTSDGEALYVGRVMYEGTFTVGKIHPSHGCLYISFAGREISFREYEVMVLM